MSDIRSLGADRVSSGALERPNGIRATRISMNDSHTIDADLLDLLVCPRDHTRLRVESGALYCAQGHRYSVVGGVPILLLGEKEHTIGVAKSSLDAAETGIGGPLFIDTLGISYTERRGVERAWSADSSVDAVISYLVGATSGWAYNDLIGKMERYPIPNIPIGNGAGKLMLDVGCSWGRWSVSAARKGWKTVGLDPSLGAVLAAKRAFSSKGFELAFVCGDARFLPFRSNLFDCVFSYSVIQHFSENDAELAVKEIGRVLSQGGIAKIQMAHKGGLRSTYSRTRPDYLDSGQFRVRYWSLASLRSAFSRNIGSTTIVAEGFGGLGLLNEDKHLLSRKTKFIILLSTLLKKLSSHVSLLISFADSVYVISRKE